MIREVQILTHKGSIKRKLPTDKQHLLSLKNKI